MFRSIHPALAGSAEAGVEGVASRAGDVEQQEAGRDADVFVEVDRIAVPGRALFCPESVADQRGAEGVERHEESDWPRQHADRDREGAPTFGHDLDESGYDGHRYPKMRHVTHRAGIAGELAPAEDGIEQDEQQAGYEENLVPEPVCSQVGHGHSPCGFGRSGGVSGTKTATNRAGSETPALSGSQHTVSRIAPHECLNQACAEASYQCRQRSFASPASRGVSCPLHRQLPMIRPTADDPSGAPRRGRPEAEFRDETRPPAPVIRRRDAAMMPAC